MALSGGELPANMSAASIALPCRLGASGIIPAQAIPNKGPALLWAILIEHSREANPMARTRPKTHTDRRTDGIEYPA